jgi:hypothetical protein
VASDNVEISDCDPIARGGCQAQPHIRQHIILRHSLPLAIHGPQIGLRAGVPAIGCLPIKSRCSGQVSLDPTPFGIHDAEIVRGSRIALGSSLAKLATLNRNGVPAFAGPEGCAAALAAMQPRAPAAGPAEDSGSAAPDGLRSGPLDELESKQLFARFGIAAVREAVAATPAAAEAAARGLGDRIVVKLRSREVVHKSEVGGVKLAVDPAAVAAACETMAADLRRRGLACGGFLIQEMVRGGVEMILGFHRDPQLGPAVLLGYGGITAELFEDVAIRLLPIGRTDAQAMVNELKARNISYSWDFAGRRLATYRR